MKLLHQYGFKKNKTERRKKALTASSHRRHTLPYIKKTSKPNNNRKNPLSNYSDVLITERVGIKTLRFVKEIRPDYI